jgi:hypothetical protein
VDVGKYSSVHSDDGEDDAEQCNCCEFVDKLHTNVDDAACYAVGIKWRLKKAERSESSEMQ